MRDDKKGEGMGQVIQIDDAGIKDHLGEMVRGTVEETLNAMLDAEADRLCGAGRYERNEGRRDTRAGSHDRSLHLIGLSCSDIAQKSHLQSGGVHRWQCHAYRSSRHKLTSPADRRPK